MIKTVVCGIDAGLETLKIVLLQDTDVIYSAVIPIEANTIADITETALNKSVSACNITREQISGIYATGIGASDIPNLRKTVPEAWCLTTAMKQLQPGFEGVVLDIGAQRSIAVHCNDGLPMKIAYNDRCASGSGLYLEMVAQLLDMDVTDIGDLALQSQEKISIQSTCAIYAETEIISLLHNRKRPEDILKGVYVSVVARIYPLLIKSGYIQGRSKLAIVGGIAHNTGMLKAIEERVSGAIWVPENPDIPGALGAALLGDKEISK